MSEWIRVGSEIEGVVYLTKIDDGHGEARNEAKLQRIGGLWFTPNMHNYVYYNPTHYKEINRD